MENQLQFNNFQTDEITDEEFINENIDKELESVRYATQVYDIDGLIRRLQDGDLVVPQFRSNTEELETEGFQREFVWKKQQMDRFIESILVGFPVPGIFLVEQSDNRLLVLDGQQRLTTLRFFKEGRIQRRNQDNGETVNSPFVLKYVSDEFSGKSYEDLSSEQQRKFRNTGITTTIVRTVPEPGDLSTIYQIFERINSGGTKLTPHQIRIATFAGRIVGFIEEINNTSDWRHLYGKYDVNAHDHEIISRILALYFNWENYSAPMKEFINDFYEKHRYADNPSHELENAKQLFLRVTSLIRQAYLDKGWAREHSISYVDSLYVGLMKRIEKSEIGAEELLSRLHIFSDELDWQAVSRNGSDKFFISQRMRAAIEVFGE
ncbi:DUF262 domain-containing protein [Rothia sp. LK2492]|uniref:DUF262 domain-containing protein n=1 Tax=Rothia sp. LK2492 TaxID=3114370 RepID=UPI0034CD9E3C